MIACECGGCGSTYKVKDQNAGKKFQCKNCDEVVRVPAGRKSSQSGSGRAAPKRRRKAARPKRQQPEYDDYEDYSADEYQDDSYDDYEDYDDGYDDYAPAPRRRSAPKKKKKKKRRSYDDGPSFNLTFRNPLVVLGIPFVGALMSSRYLSSHSR